MDLIDYDAETALFWCAEGLSTRAANCLSNARVRRMTDLLGMTSTDLLAISNLGPKTLAEISRFITAKLAA